MSKFNELYESTKKTLVVESVEGATLDRPFYARIGVDEEDISDIKGSVSDAEGNIAIDLVGHTSLEVLWRTYEDGTLEIECMANTPLKNYKFFAEKSEMGPEEPVTWQDGVYQASTICEAYNELNKITEALGAQ